MSVEMLWLTLVGWQGDGEALTLWDKWAATASQTRAEMEFLLQLWRDEFLQDARLHTCARNVLTSLSCGGSW